MRTLALYVFRAMGASIIAIAIAIVALAIVACAGNSSNEHSTASSESDAGSASDAAIPSFGDGTVIDPLTSDAALGVRVAALFTSCKGITGEASCHASGAGGLQLNIASDGGDVIGVASTERPELLRVARGDPEDSYLYLKVLGDGGIDGDRMPKGVPDFDPRLPALIHAWIEGGAPLPPD